MTPLGAMQELRRCETAILARLDALRGVSSYRQRTECAPLLLLPSHTLPRRKRERRTAWVHCLPSRTLASPARVPSFHNTSHIRPRPRPADATHAARAARRARSSWWCSRRARA